METRYARGPILGFFLALAPCVQPAATAAVTPLTIEGLTASFDESGVLIEPTPLPGRWSWRYTLTTFGRAGLRLPAPPPVLTADAGKRELVRPGLREAYEIKDAIKGFEQTFIIEQPPPGKGSILLEGRVTTDLEPEGGIRLPNRVAYLRGGVPQLQYANLAVYDAAGRALAARMDWTEDGQTISLWIDEEGQYPITVDPGIGGCTCLDPPGVTHCWCTAVALCVSPGTDCVDPMHAALSPLKIDGSVGGAAFFYRTTKLPDPFDFNKMIMLETGSTGSSAGAPLQYPIDTDQSLACSGHSFLPDGRLFIAGGSFDDGIAANEAYIWRDLAVPPVPPQNALQPTSIDTDNKMCGQPATIGNPAACVATPLPGFTGGNRWYPTTIPLWDGRIMVIGGAAEWPLETWNNSYEFYSPTGASPGPGEFTCNNDFRIKDSAGCNMEEFGPECNYCWNYPMYHATPEGLLFAGPLHYTFLFSYTHLEDDLLQASNVLPFLHRETESRLDSASVMLEVNLNDQIDNQTRRVLLVGGKGVTPAPPALPVHLDTAEVFDAQAIPPTWRWTGCDVGEENCQINMQKVRKYPKTVLLPNRTVLIVGGERSPVIDREDHLGEKSSEIFDPTDERFESLLLMDPTDDTKNRRYHSEAFLLPDGRVITAGDDIERDDDDEPQVGDPNGATYNLYYPTYMSLARPTIITWPATIAWDGSSEVSSYVCASGISGAFDSVILVRPSSTTHSVDFDHRQVQLDASVPVDSDPCSETRINLTLPESGAGDWKKHVLPPGYYMLIVRKYNGEDNPPIPSVAKFVKLVKP